MLIDWVIESLRLNYNPSQCKNIKVVIIYRFGVILELPSLFRRERGHGSEI